MPGGPELFLVQLTDLQSILPSCNAFLCCNMCAAVHAAVLYTAVRACIETYDLCKICCGLVPKCAGVLDRGQCRAVSQQIAGVVHERKGLNHMQCEVGPIEQKGMTIDHPPGRFSREPKVGGDLRV